MKPEETLTSKPTNEAHIRFWLRVFIVVIIAGGMLGMFVGTAKRTIHSPVTWKDVLGPPASQAVDESKPLSEQTARVELGNRVFNIPLMYIDSRKAPNGVYKDSILLEVIWPDMRSIYELKDRQEYERIRKQERRIGWLLAEPARLRPTLDWQVANTRPGLTKEEHIGTDGTVEHFLWYRGLPENPTPWREVYLDKDKNGHIINRIECSRGPGSLFPICEHKFIDDGIYYDISYHEAPFLSEWREQRDRAIDFLRSFETTSSNQQQHGG